MLIPNETRGRLCFLFCGGVILGTGAALVHLATRKPRVCRTQALNEGVKVIRSAAT